MNVYHFFGINNMKICKPTVKFIVSLTSLIKKMNNILKIIYNFIKIWAFNYRKVGHFSQREILFLGGALGLGLGLALFKAPIFLSNQFC